MEKINIAELLKGCPQGMELNCTLFDNVTFVEVDTERDFPIEIKVDSNYKYYLTKEGCYHKPDFNPSAKCVIFPKGKTSWEGFVPPCKFNDGDVVVAEGKSCQLFLLKHVKYREDNNGYDGYCYFGWDFLDNRLFEEGNWGFNRLATEEEKVKLFDAIKANGYKWNAKTKTLEKLIVPKFKVGDKIRLKNGGSVIEVTSINNDGSICVNSMSSWTIKIKQQDNYELVNKFDINTLIPFESKVLVKDYDNDKWQPGIWGFYDKGATSYPYKLIGDIVRYCIPYKGNEHLLGKTDDCDNFYKTWE